MWGTMTEKGKCDTLVGRVTTEGRRLVRGDNLFIEQKSQGGRFVERGGEGFYPPEIGKRSSGGRKGFQQGGGGAEKLEKVGKRECRMQGMLLSKGEGRRDEEKKLSPPAQTWVGNTRRDSDQKLTARAKMGPTRGGGGGRASGRSKGTPRWGEKKPQQEERMRGKHRRR